MVESSLFTEGFILDIVINCSFILGMCCSVICGGHLVEPGG